MKKQARINDSTTLHISTDPKDRVVMRYIKNVVRDSDQNKSRYVHNPGSTWEELASLRKMFSVIWLFDGEPSYGFFITQYKELPQNVARMYVRCYSINRTSRPLTLKFFRDEHTAYARHLKPLLLDRGVDTLFFTRHATETSNNEKRLIKLSDTGPYSHTLLPQKLKKIYGYYLTPFRNIMFKQFEQHIYCFSPWIDSPPKTEFIDKLPLVC